MSLHVKAGTSWPEVLAGAVVSVGRARLLEARPILAQLTAAAVDAELVEEALARLSEPEPAKAAGSSP